MCQSPEFSSERRLGESSGGGERHSKKEMMKICRMVIRKKEKTNL